MFTSHKNAMLLFVCQSFFYEKLLCCLAKKANSLPVLLTDGSFRTQCSVKLVFTKWTSQKCGARVNNWPLKELLSCNAHSK